MFPYVCVHIIYTVCVCLDMSIFVCVCNTTRLAATGDAVRIPTSLWIKTKTETADRVANRFAIADALLSLRRCEK